jgi:Ca-activated chloride channel homolog
LKKEDFKVFENGIEQQIEYFAPVDEAFTVVLLIDRSDSVAPIIDDVKKAAIAFVNQLRPNDRAVGIAFDRKAYILNNKVRDRETLKNAIQNMTTGAGTHLHSTIEGVINRIFRGLKGRKALIVFTDGQEAWSWDQPKGAIPQFTASTNIQAAEETGTQFYSIQFDSNFRSKEGDKFMKDIPAKTGGMFFRADKLKDFNKVFGQIADELRFQYSIGYYPKEEPKKGERRQMKVTVNQPQTVVRTKTEYVFAK